MSNGPESKNIRDKIFFCRKTIAAMHSFGVAQTVFYGTKPPVRMYEMTNFIKSQAWKIMTKAK